MKYFTTMKMHMNQAGFFSKGIVPLTILGAYDVFMG